MTIEEAIQHCKEAATENRQYALEFARVNVYDSARNCQECAAEHEQLAEWLTELKQRREHEVNRAEILRLCNEIEAVITAIANNSENFQTVEDCRTVCCMLDKIGKELTGDAGTD